jgi:hypothetical protein
MWVLSKSKSKHTHAQKNQPPGNVILLFWDEDKFQSP